MLRYVAMRRVHSPGRLRVGGIWYQDYRLIRYNGQIVRVYANDSAKNISVRTGDDTLISGIEEALVTLKTVQRETEGDA